MFVFLVLLQSGTGKIPENISKLARRQFSRDRSFTKDLAAKLRVWLKFASGKKSEADFEISHFWKWMRSYVKLPEDIVYVS